jgi:DNA-binding response OmpR family regulator
VSARRILLVEDDPSLALVLEDAFRDEGHSVVTLADGRAACERILAEEFDLVVLDLMLPGMDGFEVLRRARGAGREVPVLVLTARGREADRVRGLDLGADDYVVKPFSLNELLARARARLRGAHRPVAERVQIGDRIVDFKALRIRRGGEAWPLTKTEAAMLRYFIAHPSEVLSRARFLSEIWGYDRFPTTRTVDMHVARLREKLGTEGGGALIQTVHGVGYRYDPPETEEVTGA